MSRCYCSDFDEINSNNYNHLPNQCVSRKHASIHLLSKTNPFSTTSSLPEILHGRLIMEYGTPSTPEEIAACDSSPSGVICVLRDLGSKFGEFWTVVSVVTLLCAL